jgi:hypothetical protein
MVVPHTRNIEPRIMMFEEASLKTLTEFMQNFLNYHISNKATLISEAINIEPE